MALKIGELSKATGVSVRSLRYYEKQGLLTAWRTASGYREYSPFAVEQVQTVKLYLSLGLTTEQIAGFLHCVMKNKEAFCQEILPVYMQKLTEIENQIQLLTSIKSNLEERIHAIKAENPNITEGLSCP